MKFLDGLGVKSAVLALLCCRSRFVVLDSSRDCKMLKGLKSKEAGQTKPNQHT